MIITESFPAQFLRTYQTRRPVCQVAVSAQTKRIHYRTIDRGLTMESQRTDESSMGRLKLASCMKAMSWGHVARSVTKNAPHCATMGIDSIGFMPPPMIFTGFFARHLFCSSVSRISCKGPYMFTYDVMLLGTFWYMLKNVPELMQYVAYLFGFLLGNWAFGRYVSFD
jgi:hypothetical protein